MKGYKGFIVIDANYHKVDLDMMIQRLGYINKSTKIDFITMSLIYLQTIVLY